MFIELCTKLSLMIQGHLKEDVYIKKLILYSRCFFKQIAKNEQEYWIAAGTS